ncbi:nucleoside triphosphate pyrophosphohydrolase [Actinomadura macra]|uniref:nucleoside triphosphate pyrophosphohydrolase n=1 Tax=Actinomadura macra TaxID=46164 RepID=UPI000830A24B|nr:nucleoside triphosphate pyrophosphohydrolase [Actinomadura macra]
MKDEEVAPELARVLTDIAAERDAQDRMWGCQEFPDGSGPEFIELAEKAKRECSAAAKQGRLTWRHVLTEEFFEALAETEPGRLRTELVQTAAVAVKWIESLDRRRGGAVHRTKVGRGLTEKLVRDRIPEVIESTGRQAECRVAGPDEYEALLRAKLYEEAGEYVASGDPDELADLLEVVHALAAAHRLTPDELEARRAAKATERGGFSGRVVLRLADDHQVRAGAVRTKPAGGSRGQRERR